MASGRSLTAFVLSIQLSLSLAASSSFQSSGGNFMLQWNYTDGKLMFKATCQTVGWCGVGFTESDDGKDMVNYDIVVGGYATGNGYLKDYFSTATGSPPEDAQQDYNLTDASEEDDKTVIEFYRQAMTGDDKDVQFTENTKVWIVWAYRDNDDADSSLMKHTDTGISSMKYNLIEEAMSVNTTEATTTKPPASYSTLKSSDSKFMLNWKYMDGKLMFKITCEAKGWCAVGFTGTEDGKDMKNYDIAVGGYASGAGYLMDYWSTGLGRPPADGQQDFNRTSATEIDGKTVVEFYRKAKTGDDKDVQFEDDTLVWVVWAYHSTSDADSGISAKHDATGRSSVKYNLITGSPATTKTPTTASGSTMHPTVGFFLFCSVFATIFSF